MTLELALGTGLVALTWLACGVALIVTGLLPASLLTTGPLTSRTLRISMWWGLLVLTVVVLLANLAVPLRSPEAAGIVGGAILVMALLGTIVWRRRGVRLNGQQRPWLWLLVAGLGLGSAYLAAAALGPVTNYDSGLYHLGAIAYAGDYSAIPGLANLYFPLGYANAEFPLAAMLGNGPWEGIGYRLLNGLLLTLGAVDLVLRARQRRLSVGFFVLAVGVAAAWVPMVALSDYWVTSPTSDSAVLTLTLVTTAYLVDAIGTDRGWMANAGTCVAISTLLAMLRPTMAQYAVTVLVVLAVGAIRVAGRIWSRTARRGMAAVGIAVVIAGLATAARDYVLSGWLQFPLSVYAFDVDWLAPNPNDVRTATLGAARDPLDLWAAASGWEWIPRWIGNLGSQWETYEVATLVVVAIALVVLAARSAVGLRLHALMLAMVPSVTAVIFWWLFTPPSFRFIWGPLFTVGAIPAGWALWRLSLGVRRRAARWQWVVAAGVAVPIIAVTAYSAIARFDAGLITERRTWPAGIGIPFAVAPIVEVPVQERTLPSGLTVLVPTQSDQCWLNYPLCTAQLADSVARRGDSIQDGFLP